MQNSKLQFKIKNFINPFLIIFITVILRLVPHPPNFAPIAGMALFGGAYLNKRYALVVPMIAMLVSDFFLGFHATMPFVYGSFLITGIIGLFIRFNKKIQTIFFASLFSSFVFYLITNFGVWLVSGLYPKTLNGLLQSYLYALPFFRNTILGDLFYTGLFFGGYEIMLNALSVKLKAQKSKP